MQVTELPFNQLVGLQKSGDHLVLKKRDALLNHVGSLHAGALYGLAEAASGDFIVSQLQAAAPSALALAREGSIKYKRPAEGDCIAEAFVADGALEDCLRDLTTSNRSKLVVKVRVLCDGNPVALAEFVWFFSSNVAAT